MTDETTLAYLRRFEPKLDLMNDLLVSLEVRFSVLESRFSVLEERIAGVGCSEERIVTLENRVSAFDQKLDQILVRLQHLEQRAGLVDETAS